MKKDMKETKKELKLTEKMFKEKISIGEKMSIVKSIIDFALTDGEYDCRYLEIAKVYYIAVNYLSEEYYESLEKDENGEIEIFKAHDKIKSDEISVKESWKEEIDGVEKTRTRTTKENLWQYLSYKDDVDELVWMLNDRYEEVKTIHDRNKSIETGFEGWLKETIEELKDKFITTMDSINVDKLKEQQDDLPKLLESLTPEQKSLLDKLSVLQGGKK